MTARMDAVAALAARLAGAAVGLVAVADGDRMWFVGRHGTELAELPIGHALWSPDAEPIVAADASTDPRLDDHPLVAGPTAARRVVAHPVVVGGEAVGCVVVLDPAPGAVDLDARAALATLADLVADRVALRRANLRATAAEAEALQAEDRQARMTSRLSHDLRTPMTAILGFAQLLRLEELSDNGRESVDHLLSAAKRLLAMIDEVLAVHRQEDAGDATDEAQGLEAVLRIVETASHADAARAGVTVTVDDSCRGPVVLADPRRLRRILLSLVANAVARSASGATVRVSGRREADRVRVVVSSDRESGTVDRSGAGGDDVTRDGLTLSRRLLEGTDGVVGVDAGPPRSWWLDLPAGDGPSSTQAAPAPTVGDVEGGGDGVESTMTRGRTLLYVEDDPANQRLVQRIFARLDDVSVAEALDGRTGLRLAEELSPDVVLLDLGLPDVSGREVLQALKAGERTAGIPVVVLSGEAESDRPRELEEAGAIAYVTKPFNVREMLDLVEGLLARNGG